MWHDSFLRIDTNNVAVLCNCMQSRRSLAAPFKLAFPGQCVAGGPPAHSALTCHATRGVDQRRKKTGICAAIQPKKAYARRGRHWSLRVLFERMPIDISLPISFDCKHTQKTIFENICL
jgi:hypothetical protein